MDLSRQERICSIFDSDLQATANGIRQDFQSALDKYQKYQQEKIVEVKAPPVQKKVPPTNLDRPMRYPAEDIRLKSQPPPPMPVMQPLVSNAYADDDDDDDDEGGQSEENQQPPSIPPVEIETPLLSVGEDFQAIVSIAVNPSYFFVQNTFYTHDLEKLAQSMK